MVWTAGDLQAVIGRTEDRTLDFKGALYDWRDPKNKREWCKDVTALANAAGGTLLLGVRENDDGVAEELVGVPADGLDSELSRMNGLLQTWTVPSVLPVVTMTSVAVDGVTILAVEVARSWSRPQAVREPGSTKMEFFRRTSRDSLPIDAIEVAEIVREAESLPTRLDAFHADRVAAAVAGEWPFFIGSERFYVFTVTPWAAMQTTPPQLQVGHLRPQLLDRCYVYRPTLEGVVVADTDQFFTDAHPALQQAALHRTGALEFVSASAGFYPDQEDDLDEEGMSLSHLNLEPQFVDHLSRSIDHLQDLGVDGPCSVGLTLLGTHGVRVHLPAAAYLTRKVPIRRGALHLPRLDLEELPESGDQAVAVMLRPLFDILAQAVGKPTTTSFQADGTWDWRQG